MALDASQVEHVADQPIEPAGLGDDARQTVANGPGDIAAPLKDGRAGEDARQGRAQLVAHVLQELAADAVGVSQRRDLLLCLRQPDRRARRRRLLAVQPLELGIRFGECSGQPVRLNHRAPAKRCDPADGARGRKEDDQVQNIARVGEAEAVDRWEEEIVAEDR